MRERVGQEGQEGGPPARILCQAISRGLLLEIACHKAYISVISQISRGESLTSQSTAPEVAAVALFLLGGATNVIDTEDIAVKAHAIAPGRFAWRKYPDLVNLELVRVALSDARKRENGALVSGKGKSGWSLTPAGARWCEAQAKSLLGSDLGKSRAERRAGQSTNSDGSASGRA